MNSLTISQLARRSGVPATTLRYYEKVGVIPPPARSDSGYRIYADDAVARIAFVQRAKALGVELDDLADLVRLWDGAECAPVQDRLRSLVHDQRAATRERLEELTQLAADLDAVSASIGDAACGPNCACVQPVARASAELPLVPERLIGAACTLNSDEMPSDWPSGAGCAIARRRSRRCPAAPVSPSAQPSRQVRSPIWSRASRNAARSTPSSCASTGRRGSSTSAPGPAASQRCARSSESTAENRTDRRRRRLRSCAARR